MNRQLARLVHPSSLNLHFCVNMSFSGFFVHIKMFKCPHPIFVIISPLMRTWPLICKILDCLYLTIICAMLVEIGQLVFDEDFKMFFSKCLLFCYYLPLGKGAFIRLYNSESPLYKNYLIQLWLKLAHRFWRRS
jgi:hypothetical protein